MDVVIAENRTRFSTELKEHFKSLNLSFILFPLKEEKTYKSLNSFYDFILKHQKYWSECVHGRPSEIKTFFDNLINFLDRVDGYSQNSSNWNQAIQVLNDVINQIKFNRFPGVFISPEAEFIKDQYKINYEQANAACEYLLNPSNRNNEFSIAWSNKSQFIGVIQSFFFKHPNMKNNIFTNLEDSYRSLVQHYTESLNRVDDQYSEKMGQVIHENQQFKDDIYLWKTNLEDTTKTFVDDRKKEIEDLVQLYEEKLKLEAPAQYWNETYKEYQRTGKGWMWAAIGSTIGFIGLLCFLLFYLPSTKAALNFASLKMSILLTVIISVGLFLINFFIKLSTSSFHLSRDAKERNKLTYVYLALLKDKSVEETDRTIILQSLFSRADTGLLKGDSSPTLPDGLISQALKGLIQK